MNYFEHGKVQPHRGNMQTQIYVVLYTVAWYKKRHITKILPQYKIIATGKRIAKTKISHVVVSCKNIIRKNF